MRAALLRQVGDETLDIRDDVMTSQDLQPGEVRVRIHASGVCHSDLSAMNGTLPQPAPAVLGHEGAGEVVAVGDGVKHLSVGDHIVVAWIPPCGRCRYCLGGQPNLCTQITMSIGFTPRFTYNGTDPAYGFLGTGTFSEEVVLPEEAAIAVPKDVPFEIAALLGCGVTTGVGAAINCAKLEPGSNALVIGCGGVGIATIQGARIAGAAEIVAMDTVPSKLEDAKRFGATHAVLPDALDSVKSEVTGGDGFDYVFECIGLASTMRAAYDHARRGGTAVVVGAGKMDQMIQLNAFELFFTNKSIKGTLYGSADVRRDFPMLLHLWKSGRLDLEGMITSRIDLSSVNDALAIMKRGEAIRQVITFQ